MFIVRDGRRIPFAPDEGAGGGGGPASGESGEPTPPPPASSQQEQGLTAADVARAATQAKIDAEKAIADQLGVSVGEAKRIIAAQQAAEQAQMTETQRAQAEAQAALAQAQATLAEAAATQRRTAVTAALVAQGVTDKTVQADLARLVDIDPATPPEQLDVIAQAQVEDLAKRYPAMFGGTPSGGAPSHLPGGGTRPPQGGQGGMSAFDRGRQKAAQQFGDGQRASGSANPFHDMVQ